ncbi:aldolase [Penicillium waksmanii]|uniref:aldolase n=1 Tax=Penicillium waksmanii TaxID=69791 RepID=UPI00254686BF|nr:aldolase [Penicillium waksmanii]KAJ5989534.1 aldolase [Penicillium waksmanii]
MAQQSPPVRIVEVGPRDGLQNIRDSVPTQTKLELIRRLQATGLSTIELTSVVSPRAIPQLKDCREVLRDEELKKFLQNPRLRLPVLVPNEKGLKIAIEHGVREVAVFVSATEGFSKANINCTVQEGIERAKRVAALALATKEAGESQIAVRGYVSCIFADPFDGQTPHSAVLHCVQELLQAGCYEISLGDTLGVGSPSNVHSLLAYLKDNNIPLSKLAGHFHDTYGQAVANVWEAYTCGLTVFDSSVAGLGGCPFAPGAKGNVATEDLVYMFNNAGISTGVDLARLTEVGTWISKQLSITNSSRVGTALMIKSSAKLVSGSSKSQHTKPLQWTLISETDGLLIHRSGVNLKITLDRPKNGNALTATMISDITKAVTDANYDAEISRIVITANGKFFCTGMDLGKDSTPVARGGSASDAQYARLTTLFEAIDTSPKVTIATINGPAFGGGVGLAFACDIRIATNSTVMTLSEVKLGLCPATISKYVIREYGLSFAREVMLSARPVKASELMTRGIITDVVGNIEQLNLRLDALLDALRIASPNASRMSKELIRLAWKDGGGEKQAAGIKTLFDEMMRSDADGAHGLREFGLKRKVDWDAHTLQQGKSKL